MKSERHGRQSYAEFVTALQTEPPVDCQFKLGDKVTFTNPQGSIFEGHTVIGFANDASFYGKFIHLDLDCYWYPLHPSSLSHAEFKPDSDQCHDPRPKS